MLLAKSFWWDIKTSNIEYYDIQYASEHINKWILNIEFFIILVAVLYEYIWVV